LFGPNKSLTWPAIMAGNGGKGAGKVQDASAPGTGQCICDSTPIYLGQRLPFFFSTQPNEIFAKLNEIEN